MAEKASGNGVNSISAITLLTRDMARSIRFYRALGFEPVYGGPLSPFTSLRSGRSFVNLARTAESPGGAWGRVIFHVGDVDAFYRRACAAGLEPASAPRDAEWGERYFHLLDPDGHALSFAKPLEQNKNKSEKKFT